MVGTESVQPPVLRALEDLLRRVLRSADHGIDVLAVGVAARQQVAGRRWRRQLSVAALLAAGVGLVLLGWFIGGRP